MQVVHYCLCNQFPPEAQEPQLYWRAFVQTLDHPTCENSSTKLVMTSMVTAIYADGVFETENTRYVRVV